MTRTPAAVLAALSLPVFAMPEPAADITHLTEPPTHATNSHYVSNRAPLEPSRLVELPLTAIKPEGWLARQLRFQADGFHGHLREISPYLKAEGNAWLDPNGVGEQGWEEVPYWLKGYMNCAYILGDPDMIAEAHRWIEGAINSQQADGWFGPGEGRKGIATDLSGREDLWPNMIMLFCLMDYYDYTADERVIDLMTKYFRYLEAVPEDQFLVGYWPKMRGGDQLYAIHWLYNRTGGDWLLDLAARTHRQTARWDEGLINLHNVNIAQGFREPTQWWVQSHDADDRRGAERVWREVRETYGQVPGGMFGADENARPGFTDPRQAIETCGLVEEMLSNEILIGITGDMTWADRCETVAFNDLPAAFTADMGALRYLSAPNQPVSDGANHAPGIANGGGMYLMSPHRHRCCQHNTGHGWPYFAEHLWFASPDSGVAATIYSASVATVTVGAGDGTPVTIREQTEYPFGDTIRFDLGLATPTAFPFYLRIPAWCDDAKVAVNGTVVDDAPPAGLVRIERRWTDGDTVTLTLPMKVRVTQWPTHHNFVSVDRGPLTYSLDIPAEYRRVADAGAEDKGIDPGRAAALNDRWPAYEILPTGAWNYGLGSGSGTPAADDFEVSTRDYPNLKSPWTPDTVPVALTTDARKIDAWTLDMHGLAAVLQDSPAYTDEPVEQVRLIPMGAARIRITAFPVAGTGPEANRWTAPQQPKKLYDASASHTYEGDTAAAIGDDLVPADSADHTIPRHTFWPHTGTTEWLQADFNKPRTVSSVGVYWFDDTGRGRCRVPESWRLLTREGNSWIPVETGDDFGVARDGFNTVRFAPIQTSALRLEIHLRDQFSAGVLEWKID
jgi:DUF1680 family protein